MRRHLSTAALAALLPSALLLAAAPGRALAQADAALVLGQEEYETLGRLPRGAEVTQAYDGIAALGFDISAHSNADAEEAARTIAGFLENAGEADRLIVALAGQFVTDGARTWLLTTEAEPPTLFTLDRTAVSVDSLLTVLARNPSAAVLLLGVDPEADAAFDPWLREGVGRLDVPQGVTVLTATPRVVASFLAEEMSVPQGNLSRLVAENGGIRADGYLPRDFAFMPPAPGSAAAPPPEPQPDPAELSAESALWQGAVALDTIEAYRNYIRAYPGGRYAAEAEGAIVAILGEPNRDARLAEESLGLTRDQRRIIQRNLALLDFDPRGIDGIFGPGTRAAVTNWQQQNGFPQTGYLTLEEVARIEGQAARRAAQLEAEAARQREAQRAADQAYWEETGARGDEAGLRAYLDRYPDGGFAQDAADRLRAIEEERRRNADTQERAAWDAARDVDTAESYARYLDLYPQGRFVAEARDRRAAAAEAAEAADGQRAARAAEEALGLNALTARVVEARLADLGLDPGEVDGRFDEATRRAIRNYQRERDLPLSGFLNEPTLVRLLADSLNQALDR